MIAVDAGMHYSLALSSTGKVYAWGWNGFGQLGLGDLKSRSAPTVIPNLSGVRAIAAGEAHALAIGKNQLFGWGSNESGQLGNAATRQMTPHAFLEIA
jgi:alpha-tubulin suppressor-like RCC1 family protein